MTTVTVVAHACRPYALRVVDADPSVLQQVSYLSALSPSEAAAFAKQLQVHMIGPRERLFSAGDRATAVYVLQVGRARIVRTSPDGREQTLRILAPGDSFGEVPIFDGLPSPAAVEGLEPCEVIVIPAQQFLGLLETHPGVTAGLLRHLARRIRGFTDLIEQISLQTVQARLARYLYQLAREEGVPVEEGIRVPRELTQQDLASLLGAAREVVARTLKAMADDGVLDIHRTELVIRDLDRLRELA